VPMLDHMSTLDGVTAAELRRLSLVGEYEMTVALRGRAAGRLELAREALMLRCFSGLGVELSAGFRGTLVVVKKALCCGGRTGVTGPAGTLLARAGSTGTWFSSPYS